MIKIQTTLRGVYLYEYQPNVDGRGSSMAVDLNLIQVEIQTSFERWYTSCSEFGVVRGMHLAKPNRQQYKLISCIAGRIHDVLVDLRNNSETYLQKLSLDLVGGDGKVLVVPPGVAHGFQALEKTSIVSYLISDSYSPEDEIALDAFSHELGIKWPLEATYVSQRDNSGISLVEFAREFS